MEFHHLTTSYFTINTYWQRENQFSPMQCHFVCGLCGECECVICLSVFAGIAQPQQNTHIKLQKHIGTVIDSNCSAINSELNLEHIEKKFKLEFDIITVKFTIWKLNAAYY